MSRAGRFEAERRVVVMTNYSKVYLKGELTRAITAIRRSSCVRRIRGIVSEIDGEPKTVRTSEDVNARTKPMTVSLNQRRTYGELQVRCRL